MSLYVYCLSEEKTDALEKITGAGGAKPFLITRDAINAVVSEFVGESISATRENVIAHQRVIGHVLAQTTPLPFRFGTVVTAIELGNYIDSQRERLEALFARVRGAVEMSVKIMWDKNQVAAVKKADIIEERGGAAVGPGRAFLLARQREMAASEILKRRAEEIILWMEERLSDAARESVLNAQPAEAIVVRASYLVERDRIELYRERIKRVCEERADLNFLTSGPWPPYSFTKSP